VICRRHADNLRRDAIRNCTRILPRALEKEAAMHPESYDETLIRYLHEQMILAWNRGSAGEFASVFSEHADFVAFDGTRLQGRKAIEEFHHDLFVTEIRGSRLEGGVNFVRIVEPELAVLNSWETATLPGQTNASPSRDSMLLFMVVKRAGHWEFEAMLNARRITQEQQEFADQFEALSAGDQRQVARKVAAMRH
jgi:uncharacterized protein (TIGR02246 family)